MMPATQGSKRVVIFGGTGRTGKQVATQAVREGYQVVCIGRTASQATVPQGCEAVAADVLDPDAVARVVREADIVVIALSIPRRSPSPFATVTGNKTLHSQSLNAIVEACQQRGDVYIIKVSAQGVGDSAPRTGLGFRLLVRFSNLRHAFADHAVADRRLAQSSLPWTIVRPPRLSDGQSRGPVQAGEQVATTTTTSLPRVDVAEFIVRCFDDPSWRNRCVSLAPATS